MNHHVQRPRRRFIRAGAALLPALVPASVGAGQCTPVWTGLGTMPDTVVDGTTAIWGIPGVPRATHLGLGGGPPSSLPGRVAVWDGWRRVMLGTGLSANVNDVASHLAAPGIALYAGGQFGSAGGTPAKNIAYWTTGAWSEPGGGIGSYVLAMDWCPMAPIGPALFVGGLFSEAGGLQIEGLARWNGAAWSPIGSGIAHAIPSEQPRAKAFALYDDDGPGPGPVALFVGGTFKYAGGVEVNNIARWDGIGWESLGIGIPGIAATPEALCVFDHDGPGPTGESLFAGGSSFDAGGLDTNGLARWDGVQWHTVPGWIGNSPRDMAVFDDDGPGPNKPALFVGGLNLAATGVSLTRILKWDGQQWYSVGGGVSQPPFGSPEVRTLTVLDEDGDGPNPGGLYVGGFFNVAGTIQAPGIARWGCPLPARCDANCNRDFNPVTGVPILSVADFGCFQTLFVLSDPFADCNEDGALTVADFGCFQTKFVTGCR